MNGIEEEVEMRLEDGSVINALDECARQSGFDVFPPAHVYVLQGTRSVDRLDQRHGDSGASKMVYELEKLRNHPPSVGSGDFFVRPTSRDQCRLFDRLRLLRDDWFDSVSSSTLAMQRARPCVSPKWPNALVFGRFG
jgi:hypothetical protein